MLLLANTIRVYWFSDEFLLNLKKVQYENGHFSGKVTRLRIEFANR